MASPRGRAVAFTLRCDAGLKARVQEQMTMSGRTDAQAFLRELVVEALERRNKPLHAHIENAKRRAYNNVMAGVKNEMSFFTEQLKRRIDQISNDPRLFLAPDEYQAVEDFMALYEIEQQEGG